MKKGIYNKGLLYLTVSALVLSLAGCSGSSSSTASSQAAPESQTSAPASSASAGPASGSDEKVSFDQGPGTMDEAGIVHPEGLPEDYPSQNITWIYPFGAGSINDAYVRILAEKVKELEGWDVSIVIEYAEGASGDVGWSKIADAEPDGYTLGHTPTATLISGIANGKNYTMEGLDIVCSTMIDPGIICVASGSQYNTLQELIEAAKANPGSVSIGVTSVTASEGLAVKQLETAAGCQFNIVPFEGTSAVMTAVSGNHCDALCLNVGDVKTFVDDGSLKVLATGDTTRSEYYPDVPTYQECGYDVIQSNCRAIGGPKGIDPAILQYLSNCFCVAAQQEDVKAKAADMQAPVVIMGTAEVTELFNSMEQSYRELWATSPWV